MSLTSTSNRKSIDFALKRGSYWRRDPSQLRQLSGMPALDTPVAPSASAAVWEWDVLGEWTGDGSRRRRRASASRLARDCLDTIASVPRLRRKITTSVNTDRNSHTLHNTHAHTLILCCSMVQRTHDNAGTQPTYRIVRRYLLSSSGSGPWRRWLVVGACFASSVSANVMARVDLCQPSVSPVPQPHSSFAVEVQTSCALRV